METKPVYCFGEILWDVLPDGPQPGGAPLNVAYHLTQLELTTGLISRVGNDEDGKELLNLVQQWGIRPDLMQTDNLHDTSRVLATINSDHEVSYEIVNPVAWDFIELSSFNINAVKEAPYFVYGSLAARNDVTRETLFQLLSKANFKVFDINLRPPFYEMEVLEILLKQANLLKVNDAELHILNEMFDVHKQEETEQVEQMKKQFDISEMVVTKGSRGASYYSSGGAFHAAGVPVNVCDTVGSGDAFLAALIANHYRNETPQKALNASVKMGAFIAGKKGGCPAYTLSEYQHFGSPS